MLMILLLKFKKLLLQNLADLNNVVNQIFKKGEENIINNSY